MHSSRGRLATIIRSRLRKNAEFERELDVIRPMGEPQLLLNALLVRVDGLWTDEQALTDFRRRISLSNELQNVALALRQLVESLALRRSRVFLGEVLRQHAAGRRPNVHVA